MKYLVSGQEQYTRWQGRQGSFDKTSKQDLLLGNQYSFQHHNVLCKLQKLQILQTKDNIQRTYRQDEPSTCSLRKMEKQEE